MKISFLRNLFLVFVMSFILIGSVILYVLKNQDEIKLYLLTYINKNSKFDFSYSSEELQLFPFLGIQLNNVKIANKENTILSEISELYVTISWLHFLKRNIQVNTLKVRDGYLSYTFKKKQYSKT